MKLWQKGGEKQDEKAVVTENFTVGNDRLWDMRLAAFDVLGSLAHAEMLAQVKLITTEEFKAIEKGLKEILNDIETGTFVIEEHVEDVHSQVEKILTEKTGEAGKKLHTGRSRNDQVLVDIKLYLKHELKVIAGQGLQLFDRLQQLSEQHKNDLLPGYTHFQLAMPSSFGLWFGAYAESLADDMELLAAAYKIADKNPLGSGAGYGSAFPLFRSLTTKLLGFTEMNYNSVYAQMTRGKTEKAALTGMAAIAATISKFAYDVCLYMNQQFAYVSFPESLTTGSSIMPHKKNPDIFELLRAKCNRLQAAPNEMALLCNNLPSGYHRDMQLTKDILFPAIDTMKECLEVLLFALRDIKVRKDILNDSKFDELFSVEEINKLTIKGVPFRDAYKQVGQAFNDGAFKPEHQLYHTHEGSIHNLCNEEIKAMMERACSVFKA
ncbi:MAG TPA: argininosuccinate lyase [Chitinophagales bacterium]|nr:argininosuccinate lyase [Chitinophagales bacterium]